jgi:hypothetical protein
LTSSGLVIRGLRLTVTVYVVLLGKPTTTKAPRGGVNVIVSREFRLNSDEI